MAYHLFKILYTRIHFWVTCDRLGPDIPLTHWMLHFPELGSLLARKKLSFFGARSEIRPYSYIVNSSNIRIGSDVIIRPNSMLMAASFAPINIGNNVLIGSGVHIIASNHRFDDTKHLISEQGHDLEKAGVTISDNVWIGANAIILANVKIGNHSVVAAGSIVTRDVPPYSVVAGVPAKILKHI